MVVWCVSVELVSFSPLIGAEPRSAQIIQCNITNMSGVNRNILAEIAKGETTYEEGFKPENIRAEEGTASESKSKDE